MIDLEYIYALLRLINLENEFKYADVVMRLPG